MVEAALGVAMRGWVVLGILLAGTAWAEVKDADRGTLGTLTSQAPTADSVVCDGAAKLSFLIDITAGTATTNPQVSIDKGTHWDDVGSLSANADGDVLEIEDPNGLYRMEASACAGCTVVVSWKCVNAK